MKKYFTFKKLDIYAKFFITLIFFVLVKDLGAINTFQKLVIALLEFIIILELVRMLVEFLFSSDNRIQLRFMIDSTIVFFIRDIMLLANEKLDLSKMIAILGIIATLFVFRYVSIRFSPAHMEKKYHDEHLHKELKS